MFMVHTCIDHHQSYMDDNDEQQPTAKKQRLESKYIRVCTYVHTYICTNVISTYLLTFKYNFIIKN